MKNQIKNILLVLSLVFSIACGSTQQNSDTPIDQSNSSQPSSTPSASNFFNQQQMQQTFSQNLQQTIRQNADSMRAQRPGELVLETSFGPLYPPLPSLGDDNPDETPSDGSESPAVVEAAARTCADKVGNGTNFICVAYPSDNFEVVSDSVILSGAVNMTDVAVFTPSDPIVLISVFKLEGSSYTSINETVVTGYEITTTMGSQKQVGSFSERVNLNGPGFYKVAVMAFQMSNGGTDISLQNVLLSGKKQGSPQVETVSVKASEPGNLLASSVETRYDEIPNSSLISAFALKMKFKITSPGSRGVGIFIQNYDATEGGNLRYQAPVSTQHSSQESEAEVKLFDGLNCFRIQAKNAAFPEGNNSFNLPQYCVNNQTPTAQIKILSDSQINDGAVIQADARNASQARSLRFCISNHGPLLRQFGADQCIRNWEQQGGDKPKVSFNGAALEANAIPSHDSSGVYAISFHPQVGMNIYDISVTRTSFASITNEGTTTPVVLASATGAFGFGKLNRLQDFTPRGLALELKSDFFEDLRKMLVARLNKQDIKDVFKETLSEPRGAVASEACTEYASPASPSTYPYVIRFHNQNIFDRIDITELRPDSSNQLYMTVVIHGLEGPAEIGPYDIPPRIFSDDPLRRDANFTQIDFKMRSVRLRLAVGFIKRDGVNYLDIRSVEHDRDGNPLALDIVSSDSLGRSIVVNLERNPRAAALPSSLIGNTFSAALSKLILCDTEKELNPVFPYVATNPANGSFGKWIADLDKVENYDLDNPLRLPFRQHFESLNRDLGLDVSYNVMKADFRFSNQSLRIENIPIRFNPSPTVHRLTPELLAGSVGSLSSPENVTAPRSPLISENRSLGLALSEDFINQALFAANATGLLSLTIDSNFYTDNGIGFIGSALPNVENMIGLTVGKIDVDQNGVADEEEQKLPIMMKVATSPNFPPNVHILNEAEKRELASKVPNLNTTLNYIRLTIPNLEIAYYAVRSNADSTQKFCQTVFKENVNSNLAAHQIAPMFNGVDGATIASNGLLCAEEIVNKYQSDTCGSRNEAANPEGGNLYTITDAEIGTIRVENEREPLSALPNTVGKPLFKVKANLVLHAVLYPLKNETPFDPFATTTILPKLLSHLRFVPGTNASFFNMQVIENNVGLLDSKIANNHFFVTTLVPQALTSNQCAPMNDFGIPIPTRFPEIGADTTTGLAPVLRDLGVSYLKLGGMLPNGRATENPQIDLGADDTDLFLNLTSDLDVCFLEDRACNPFLVPLIFDPSWFIRR